MASYNRQLADGVYRTDITATRLQDGMFMSNDTEVTSVLVADESKLSLVTGAAPGCLAHTAGYKKVWELATDGTTWEPV